MEPLSQALRLSRRQSGFEDAMGRPAGIRVVEEREIDAIREQLKHYPATVRAILDAASRLHRPAEALSPRDVEAGQQRAALSEQVLSPTPTPQSAKASESICELAQWCDNPRVASGPQP